MQEPDPVSQPSPDPIEPNIGVNGWKLLWALVVLVCSSTTVMGTEGSTEADTLAELLPRDRVLGRAVQVILPLHHLRELP